MKTPHTTDFHPYAAAKAVLVQKHLSEYIKTLKNAPAILRDAMAYSLNAGGKRIRPALVMASAEAFGLKDQDVMPAACAVEMLHTFSLIHDDLPCMDNDPLRRGKPTSHRVFGEATAVLAGDALSIYAFEVFMTGAANKKIGPERTLLAMGIFARASGAEGMAGGQTADIFAEGLADGGKSLRRNSLERDCLIKKNLPLKYYVLPYGAKTASRDAILDFIHAGKTASLISASAAIGAALAGAPERDRALLAEYGTCIGLAFQITDDILDLTADKTKLGKAGSDRDNGKLTYVSLHGIEKARRDAQNLTGRALDCLDRIKASGPKKLAPLYGLAKFLNERAY